MNILGEINRWRLEWSSQIRVSNAMYTKNVTDPTRSHRQSCIIILWRLGHMAGDLCSCLTTGQCSWVRRQVHWQSHPSPSPPGVFVELAASCLSWYSDRPLCNEAFRVGSLIYSIAGFWQLRRDPKFFSGLPQHCVIYFSPSKYGIIRLKYILYDCKSNLHGVELYMWR